jgi:superfamily II DNA or RNA helicase
MSVLYSFAILKLWSDRPYITGEGINLDGGVIVSTIQSFVKQPQELLNSFDMVIVDEVHRFSKAKGQYFDVLSRMIAPYRYGLTATLNKNQEVALLTEGLIGPLIGEFTLKEGIEKGILAKPKLKFITIPLDYKVRNLRRYQEVYEMGVVLNRARNRMIIKTAKDLAKDGKTSLILISKIEHGNSLVEMSELIGHQVVFIQGKDDSEIRENVRGALNRKEIKTVIATQIWKEGVDIKTLDAVINAAGGKSEIAVLQSLGRGLRTAEGKESILLVDILDLSHHYLTSHLAERLAIYSQEEWL